MHAGPVGAGHFVKMIHNGIEYGMMQAIAEGFDICAGRSVAKVRTRRNSTSTCRRRRTVASRQRRVILAARPDREPRSPMTGISNRSRLVEDSGEGR